MEEQIDYEKLREDLMDYFGAAMMCYPMAVIDLSNVENASCEELISIAINNAFNLDDYIIQFRRR